jgi:hypothetical protein
MLNSPTQLPRFAAVIERQADEWPVAGFDAGYYMGAKANACKVVWNLAMKHDVRYSFCTLDSVIDVRYSFCTMDSVIDARYPFCTMDPGVALGLCQSECSQGGVERSNAVRCTMIVLVAVGFNLDVSPPSHGFTHLSALVGGGEGGGGFVPLINHAFVPLTIDSCNQPSILPLTGLQVEVQCPRILDVLQDFLECEGLSDIARTNAECACFAVASFRTTGGAP